MRSMHIRPYLPSDEDAVVALWTVCGLVRPWNDPRRDIARKLTVQPELFLVGCVPSEGSDAPGAEAPLVATAMAGYDGHRGWVNYLAVSPGHRQLSLGRQLMEHIEHELLARGCPKVNLQVRVGNEAVLAFYARLGYSQDAAISLGKRLIPDA